MNVCGINMRLPDSGALLESMLDGLSGPETSGDATFVEDVNDAQLVAALGAMERGDIEYVILERGDEFLQAAGERTGPYALQFQPSSGDMLEVRGGVDAATARAAMLGYHRGDPGWRGSLRCSAVRD